MPEASAPQDGLLDSWGRRNRRLLDRPCPACGQTFRPLRASSAFCSRPCARTKNGGHNRKPQSWWIGPLGYVVGRVWEDGKRRDVRQHRHLVEQALGRRLESDEDVHHINGDKTDNRLENLEVLTHGAHSRITNSGRVYRRGYKLDLSESDRAARAERMRKIQPLGIAALRKAPDLPEAGPLGGLGE